MATPERALWREMAGDVQRHRQRYSIRRPPADANGFAIMAYRIGSAVVAFLAMQVWAWLALAGGADLFAPGVLAVMLGGLVLWIGLSELLRTMALEEYWEVPTDGILPVTGQDDPELLAAFKNSQGVVELPMPGPLHMAVTSLWNVVFAGLCILMLAPLLAMIAILIRLDSPGPIFYRSERIGRHGRAFWMLLFRTMRTDAEAVASAGAEWGGEGDPRISRVGRFVRRWSLDQLPQLLNVLRRDMNFVGPRPLSPEMSGAVRRMLGALWLGNLVRPGITGASQLAAGALKLDDMATLEIRYLSNQSVLGDFRIIIRTVGHVVMERV